MLLLCLLLVGCASTGWQDVKPHYDSQHPPANYEFTNISSRLYGVWASPDGTQVWAVGVNGTILQYSTQTRRWEAQTSGTTNHVYSILGSSDGEQLWAVGSSGTILHYSRQTGRWEAQTSGTANHLYSIVGSSGEEELWAVGWLGTILHYSPQTGHWEAQTSGTTADLLSIFVSGDGSQLWTVGEHGTILHFSRQTGRWEAQASGTDHALASIFGRRDGAEVWAVGENGTILHYSERTRRWEAQTSGTDRVLVSICGIQDGSQLWAAGGSGTILHYSGQTGRWETQASGTPDELRSIFASRDGADLWAVGHNGTILHASGEQGRWETQASGTDHPLVSIYGVRDGAEVWAVGDNGTILHSSGEQRRWEGLDSGARLNLMSIFGSGDGSQLWAVGDVGTILHYSRQTGRWEDQTSSTTTTHRLNSIFGSSDGSQLWAVGEGGTILHYSQQAGRWEPQTSSTTTYYLYSVFASGDGSQLWAGGADGMILHYSQQTGRWEVQNSGTSKYLRCIFGSTDGSQAWAVGGKGTILHYSRQTGRWEPQNSGTVDNLSSIFGSSDGSQLWTVGEHGTILHYSQLADRWEAQSSGTTDGLSSIFVSSDGSQVWAVGDKGNILRLARKGVPAYISEVQLLPELSGAALVLRVVNHQQDTMLPVKLTLYGSRRHSFEIGNPPKEVRSPAQPPAKPNDPWLLEFNPADIDVDPGTEAHLQIVLQQGAYKATYDVDVTYDRYRFFRLHWVATLAVVCVGALLTLLTSLLFFRPLWLLYLYRQLKIYNVVEQINVPGVGKLLQALLKLTILPWFITHPRTLSAWVRANRTLAARAWSTSLKMPRTRERGDADPEIPFFALPIRIEDVSLRMLNQPVVEDFESLFHSARTVIQIVGPGGGGKTTLAKHIGDLAIAGGEAGAFQRCRLPIWIDEDFTDLRTVVKRKISSWYETAEDIEDEFLDALLEKGLLLVMVDRVSERLQTTQAYLSRVYGSVRCNALLITARYQIPIEVPSQRFIYPQSLDSSTLLNFMTEIIKHFFLGSDSLEARPFSTLQSQLELGTRLADLISIKSGSAGGSKQIPMLPLPVVLFVSDAVTFVKQGRSLDELPKSLPDVYANYLRRINPKVSGIENGMSDEDMLRAAKALAKLALGTDCIPKEFTRDQGGQHLKTELPDLPAGVDALRRLVANGVLLSKEIGATTFFRFALDPVAEFLAAEAHYDACEGKEECLQKLLLENQRAQGFHHALLLTIQTRQQARASSSAQASA